MKALKYIIFIAEYFMIGFLYISDTFTLTFSRTTELIIWFVYAVGMGIKAIIIWEEK